MAEPSPELDQPCEVEWRLAPGGDESCDLAFEVPVRTLLTRLWYDDGTIAVSTDLDAESPEPDISTCSALADSQECSDCLLDLDGSCPFEEPEGCDGMPCLLDHLDDGEAMCACAENFGRQCAVALSDFVSCMLEACPVCDGI